MTQEYSKEFKQALQEKSTLADEMKPIQFSGLWVLSSSEVRYETGRECQ